jgi:hypothetical protein
VAAGSAQRIAWVGRLGELPPGAVRRLSTTLTIPADLKACSSMAATISPIHNPGRISCMCPSSTFSSSACSLMPSESDSSNTDEAAA